MKCYIDEAWRWPLYWPVHVWLVVTSLSEKKLKHHPYFKDSKSLSEKRREIAFKEIIDLGKEWSVSYEIGSSSSKEIDQFWMTRALNLAIYRALYKLLANQLNTKLPKNISIKKLVSLIESFKKEKENIELIIDWNSDFWMRKELNIPITTIIHWDSSCIEISMASILAKVSRDHLLKKEAEKYPKYWFEKHKGYGTKLHYSNINQYGTLPQHRKLFLKKIFPEWKIQKFNISNNFALS